MSNKPKYLVIQYASYGAGAYGRGESLEKALEELEGECGELDREELQFFEVTPVEVEFKIVKKEVVQSIKKTKGACDE